MKTFSLSVDWEGKLLIDIMLGKFSLHGDKFISAAISADQ